MMRLATRALFGLALCFTTAPQSAGQWLAFEVATIKPATQADMQGVYGNLFPTFLERPVIDLTGLTGAYDFTLYWVAEYPMMRVAPKAPAAEEAIPDPVPTIFQAIQDQLGLRLDPRKARIEILVIDRAEKIPTEN
jgi:uncharacterized protein (TIGR03435 family)